MTTEATKQGTFFFIIDTIVSTRILFILIADMIYVYLWTRIALLHAMIMILNGFMWSC